MKIIIYCVQLEGRGGLETILRTIHPLLASMGQEVYYLFPSPANLYPEWENDIKPNVYYTQRNQFGITERFANEQNLFPSMVLDLQNALINLPKPDIFISVSALNTVVARLAFGVYGKEKPVLFTWIHESLHAVPSDHLNFFNYADAHLAISDGIRQQFGLINNTKPVALVYNPLSMDDTKIIKKPMIPTFIYMARLDNKQKRLDVLFLGLSKLPHRNFVLRIFGDATRDSSEQVDLLKQLAKTLQIDQQIEWVGWKENPWTFVHEATALVLSSDWEGLPCVLIEALSRGLPVISSDCPVGPSEIIQNNSNGWLFKQGDSDELCALIEKVISNDIPIPSAETCITSVTKFRAEYVVQELIKVFQHYRDHL